MRLIRVARSRVLADEPVYDGDGGQFVASIGELVDCWQEHRGDPSKRLVGGDASKHLRDACKKHDIRSKDHS